MWTVGDRIVDWDCCMVLYMDVVDLCHKNSFLFGGHNMEGCLVS